MTRLEGSSGPSTGTPTRSTTLGTLGRQLHPRLDETTSDSHWGHRTGEIDMGQSGGPWVPRRQLGSHPAVVEWWTWHRRFQSSQTPNFPNCCCEAVAEIENIVDMDMDMAPQIRELPKPRSIPNCPVCKPPEHLPSMFPFPSVAPSSAARGRAVVFLCLAPLLKNSHTRSRDI